MQLVSQFCGTQLLAHMDCVSTNPREWQVKCEATKMDLARCAQEK